MFKTWGFVDIHACFQYRLLLSVFYEIQIKVKTKKNRKAPVRTYECFDSFLRALAHFHWVILHLYSDLNILLAILFYSLIPLFFNIQLHQINEMKKKVQRQNKTLNLNKTSLWIKKYVYTYQNGCFLQSSLFSINIYSEWRSP